MYKKEFVQFGTFSVIILFTVFITLAVLLIHYGIPASPVTYILLPVIMIIFLSLLVFYKLTITVDSNYLSFRMGIGVFGKKYRLSDIKSCKPVKNNLFYGTGIKLIPKGWLYNVSGLKAIELCFHNRTSVVRIGTDQPEVIAEVVNNLIKAGKIDESEVTICKNSLSFLWLILVFLFLMIPLGLLISNQKEISVKINDKGLEIEGFYGLNIPYTNITLIDTVSQLPPVRMRTNGYAFGRICIGNFRLMDGRDVKLFIKRGHQPYIFLKTMDNIIIYFNFKDPANTNKTFLQIKEKI